jgi:hypothetical protein
VGVVLVGVALVGVVEDVGAGEGDELQPLRSSRVVTTEIVKKAETPLFFMS